MNTITLALVAILLPFFGAFLSLLLSQLDEYIEQEGKTRDWLIIILIFIPLIVITALFLPNLHINETFTINWLPGTTVGLRTNELSKAFSIFLTIATTVVSIFSISHLSDDKARGSFWFFLLLTVSGMMLAFFANNLYWLFGGFELATISGFFLISHLHRKSGEEGVKAGKTGIRFFFYNFLGDILLLISFALIIKAFGSPIFVQIFRNWNRKPLAIFGGSISNTKLIIKILMVLGALIKSAQFPLLFWPLSGEKLDFDMDKTPLPIIPFLVNVTLGTIGLYTISNFYPLFTRGLTSSIGIDPTIQIPLIIIGWMALLSMLIAIIVILSTNSINRTVAAIAVFQLSTCYLAISSGNDLGLLASFIHLLSGTPAVLALTIIFGMIFESLRMKNISRLKGLGTQFQLLKILAIFACLIFLGVFPFGTFFSRDLIFAALISSVVSSHTAIVVIFILLLLFVTFGLTKTLMKILYGKINEEEFSVRNLNVLSIITEVIVLLWSAIVAIIAIFWQYPNIRFARGFFNTSFILDYDFPIFSNWILSPIILLIVPIFFTLSYFGYKDGIGGIFEKIRRTKIYNIVKELFANIFYYEYLFNHALIKPTTFLGKYISWTRLKTPVATIIWAVLSLVLLVSILFVTGGGM